MQKDKPMKSEQEIRETMNYAETMKERYEDNEGHMEAIGVGVIKETLRWVLEEDENDTLLEDLREDVEETADGEIDFSE